MASKAFVFLRRIMPFFSFAAPACILAFGAFANDNAGTGISSKDKAKWRLAIQAAARQSLENLESLSLSNSVKTVESELAGRLSAYMLQNASGCRADAQARQVCWWAIREVKRAEFQAAVSNAAIAAQEFSPLPLDSSNLFAKLGPGWTARMDAAIGLFLTNRFESIYTVSRSRAVALQRQAVEEALKFPSQDELESRLNQLAKQKEKSGAKIKPAQFDSLKQWLASRFTPDSSLLFEETSVYVGDLGNRMLDEIKNQYYFQLGAPESMIANNSVPLSLITAEAINNLFQDALNKVVAGASAARSGVIGAATVPLYEVFNSARDYAKALSEHLEQDRALEFINKSPLLVPDSDKLEAAIKRDPQTHRDPVKSMAYFKTELSEYLRGKLALEYSAKADQPNTPDAAIRNMREYFARAFAETPAIASAFQARLESELNRILPPIREPLAAAQFKEFFPELASNSGLPETALETILDRKRAKADNLKKVLDFMEAAGISLPLPADQAKCLDETSALVVKAWQAWAENACAAFDAQMALLHQIETNRLAQLERDVSTEKPLEAILKDWTSALEQAWSSRSKAEAPDFPAIFNTVHASLDKTVRQFFDAQRRHKDQSGAVSAAQAKTPAEEIPTINAQIQHEEQPEQTAQTTQPAHEPKPQATLPEPAPESPRETEAGASADVVLVFTDAPDGRAFASWTISAPAAAGESVFEPANIEEAVDAIITAMQADFEKMLEARLSSTIRPKRSFLFFTRRSEATNIKFLVSVKSRAIRHQMSLLLRRRIAEIADEWGSRKGLENLNVSLGWNVGM